MANEIKEVEKSKVEKVEKTFPDDKLFELKNINRILCSPKEKRADCIFFRDDDKIGEIKGVTLIENKEKTRVYTTGKDITIWVGQRKGERPTCAWVNHKFEHGHEIYCQKED